MDGAATVARYLAGEATPVVRRLDNFLQLNDSACLALSRAASAGKQSFSARMDFYSDGRPRGNGRFLLQGYACDYVLMPDGRRQIINLIMPGDELHGFAITGRAHNICLLTDAVVSDASPALVETTMQIGEIAIAVRRAAAAADAMRDERIISLGRRSAKERLAHLFCEIFYRSHVAGLTKDSHCSMPLTQSDLADILGLSLVHVNRSLQLLRVEDLLKLEQRSLVILDLPRLEKIAYFDPGYLAYHRQPAKASTFPFIGRSPINRDGRVLSGQHA